MQVLREADFIARKAPYAAQAVSPNLFRIARPINALISDRREKCGLQSERKHVEHSTLQGQRLDGGDDRSSDAAAMYLARYRNRRNLGHRRRIFLECAARDNVATSRHADHVVVDRELHHLRCAST